MKNRTDFVIRSTACLSMLLLLVLFYGCSEDPKPVNEEELITTLIVDLTPVGGGDAIQLKFYDADGDGVLDPVITPMLAQLTAAKTYGADLILKNESVVPADDITLEIDEEKNDHLFCFAVTGTDITIGYNDEDENANPVGLSSTWTAGNAGGAGNVKITLRHQPGTKDGSCPGTGDTDIEVTFDVQVVD